VIQPDGKFIVTGTYTTLWGPFGDDEYRTFYTVRYNADGTLDESFGDGGAVATVVTPMPNLGDIDDHAFDVTLQADGKIVVVGESQGDFALVRYNPDGSPRHDFWRGWDCEDRFWRHGGSDGGRHRFRW
jgi:uncharacterized delta-60 repeat protein